MRIHFELPFKTTLESPYFTFKGPAPIFEIIPPEIKITDIFSAPYDSTNIDSIVAEYNRLDLAIKYLSSPSADSLRPLLEPVRGQLSKIVNLKPIYDFNGTAKLTDLTVNKDKQTEKTILRLAFMGENRFLENYRIAVTATRPYAVKPEYSFLLSPPTPPMEWLSGQLIVIRTEIPISPGNYVFRVSMTSDKRGELDKAFARELTVEP